MGMMRFPQIDLILDAHAVGCPLFLYINIMYFIIIIDQCIMSNEAVRKRKKLWMSVGKDLSH